MLSISATVLAWSLVTGAQTQIVRVGDVRPAALPAKNHADRPSRVSAAELAAWARQQLAEELPAGLRVLDVSAAHALALPAERSSARLAFARELAPGVNAGQLILESAKASYAVPLRVALGPAMATKAVPVIKRGAEIMVVVRSGNVMVQSAGISQEAGAVGEHVSVLPQSSQRVVRGTVVDAKTVEVAL